MTLASLKIHLRGSKRRRRKRKRESGPLSSSSSPKRSSGRDAERTRREREGKRSFPSPPSVLISVFSSPCGFFSYDASATEGEKRKRKKKKRGGEATSKEEEEVGGKAAAMRGTINHPSAQAKGSFSHRLANSPSSCSWWWWSRERERKDIRGLLARSLENHLRP